MGGKIKEITQKNMIFFLVPLIYDFFSGNVYGDGRSNDFFSIFSLSFIFFIYFFSSLCSTTAKLWRLCKK